LDLGGLGLKINNNKKFRIYPITRYEFQQQICTKSSVANPNWAMGRIRRKFQKYRLLGQLLTEAVEKHSKYRKITDFYSKIGPQKLLWRAVGWPSLH
jgi:hypothetical protein